MKTTYFIEGMHCAACVSNVEKALKRIKGVKNATVNLTMKSATIETPVPVPVKLLQKNLRKAGYAIIENSGENLTQRQSRETSEWRKRFLAMAILGIPLLIYAMWNMFSQPGPPPKHSILIQFFLTTPIIFIGAEYYRNGLKSLFYKSPNMNSLVALGTGSAYFYSILSSLNLWYNLNIAGFEKLYFESAGVILLFITLGRWLEAKAKGRTTEVLTALLDSAPKTGWVKRGGEWMEISVGDIIEGDQIQIKPGSQIPVDGTVIDGKSYVDESSITGESAPVEKKKGDPVTGATMNTSGNFIMVAEKVGDETLYARIIQMVQEAQGSKAPIQTLADKVASIFVPVVLALAIIGAAFWLIRGEPMVFAMNIFISVLIIACPCALGLATPTAMVVGTGIGADLGIHFKSAEDLERMSTVNTIIFDKTGTLTTGRSSVTNIEHAGNVGEFQKVLFSLESHSEHHIASTIISYLEGSGVSFYPVDSFSAILGLGISGKIKGKPALAGSLSYLIRENITIPEEATECDTKFKNQGKTVIHAAIDNAWLGLVAVSDEIRGETEQVVFDLQKRSIEIWMITGDNEKTAQIVGQTIGIHNIMSEILPEDKSKKVNDLKLQGKIVAMVGDGVNDAPALATADVGISISSGTDVAIETADIVLIRPDLTGVNIALALSRAVVKKIRQNLFWAFFYNILGIPIAMGVLYPFTGHLMNPMLAGAAMAFSSVSVISNTLLLKEKRF